VKKQSQRIGKKLENFEVKIKANKNNQKYDKKLRKPEKDQTEQFLVDEKGTKLNNSLSKCSKRKRIENEIHNSYWKGRLYIRD